MINVIVVVDPNYGDRLETATQVAPVWVVATIANKAACERMWKAQPTDDHREKSAVTCYDVASPEGRLANLLSVVPTLEEHHGEIRDDRFLFPEGFVLGVLGLAPANAVIIALREFGFSSFVEMADGFKTTIEYTAPPCDMTLAPRLFSD